MWAAVEGCGLVRVRVLVMGCGLVMACGLVCMARCAHADALAQAAAAIKIPGEQARVWHGVRGCAWHVVHSAV